MIKSKNVLKIINNFKKVLPMAKLERHLNMKERGVNSYHECGTTHCHAGWYAIAACDLQCPLTFSDGAIEIEKDLGFKNGGGTQVMLWARDNPDIWGNDYGNTMFSSALAFIHKNKRPFGAENLQHIIDHWQEVYERVKTIELLSEPPVDNMIEKVLEVKELELETITN